MKCKFFFVILGVLLCLSSSIKAEEVEIPLTVLGETLPQGVYVLLLKENGNIVAETKVILQ